MKLFRRPLLVFCGVLGLVLAITARADDRDALAEMLDWFLATVTEPATHERFWADDLVYTSSDGSRFGKAAILEGLGDDGPVAEGPAYAATEVDIRMYGDTAVLAFRLVASPGGKAGSQEERMEYFNTGTFLKRDGEWRAVAWQATRIPPES
jgi:ketosteroid isomerase-like protein